MKIIKCTLIVFALISFATTLLANVELPRDPRLTCGRIINGVYVKPPIDGMEDMPQVVTTPRKKIVSPGKLVPLETILVHSKEDIGSNVLQKIIKTNYNTAVIFTEKEYGVEPESPGAAVILPVFICDTCTNFSTIIDIIAHSLKGVTFIEVDRVQFPELFKEYKITKAPTLLAFKGGQLRIALNGAAPYEPLISELLLNLYDQGDYPPFCAYAE